MQLTPIHIDRTNCGMKGYRELYESAFPREEQIPFEQLITLTDYQEFDFTAWMSGEHLIGMTIVLQLPKVNWFWYFAVVEQARGQGIGQHILTLIKQRYSNAPLVLDMESPQQPSTNHEQRLRRREFYRRNGFSDTDTLKTYDGVDYTIMVAGEGTFTQADYDRLITHLHRYWDHLPANEQ